MVSLRRHREICRNELTREVVTGLRKAAEFSSLLREALPERVTSSLLRVSSADRRTRRYRATVFMLQLKPSSTRHIGVTAGPFPQFRPVQLPARPRAGLFRDLSP